MDLRTRLSNGKEVADEATPSYKVGRTLATAFGALHGGATGAIIGGIVGGSAMAVPVAALAGLGGALIWNGLTSKKTAGKNAELTAKQLVKEENKKYRPDINPDRLRAYVNEQSAYLSGYSAGRA